MVTINTIKLSNIEGSHRLEAEYYQPNYLKLYSELGKTKTISLEKLCYFIKKGIFDLSPLNYANKGIPFIRTSEIKKEIADLNDVVFLPSEIHNENSKTELNGGDIVFTKIGANIGDSSILSKKFKKYNFSQNVVGAKIRKNKISSYYLVAFLTSRFGREQLKRVQMLSGQGKLELADIKNILIPRLGDAEKKCKEQFIHAESEIEKSIEKYFQAEKLLLSALDLEKFVPKNNNTFSNLLKNTLEAERFDSEFFQPLYDDLVKKLTSNFECKKLRRLAERVKTKDQIKQNLRYKYIEINDIGIDIGEVNYTERESNDLPSNARIPIKGGELIISKVRPTRGAIGIIPKLPGNVVCSSAFSVFTVESPMREFLYVITRTFIGKLQMERQTTGTSYPIIKDWNVENILIPLIPLITQRKISSLIQEVYESRKKAYNLIDSAHKIIESSISKRH